MTKQNKQFQMNSKWMRRHAITKKTLHSCKIVHSAKNKNDFLSVKSRWDKFIMGLILSLTLSHDSFLECARDVIHDSQQIKIDIVPTFDAITSQFQTNEKLILVYELGDSWVYV